MSPRVIHTAQALVDEVVQVPELPRRGGNVMASEHVLYAGGAVNILIAAARSGADCVHAGAHGIGPNGDIVRAALTAEGIALASAPIAELDTGVCFVMIEPTAERTFVTTQGAERRITPESLAQSHPQSGDLVCISGFSLVGRTRDPLLTWLDDLPADVVVVLDPGATFADVPDDLQQRVLGRVDVWTSNLDEARSLTGESRMAVAAPLVAARIRPGGVAIVRDGPNGCVVHADATTTPVPGYPRTPVDTNGAGDTHTGVLLACRAAGDGWVESARRANAAGAIKVTRRGPASSPNAAEIDAFLAVERAESATLARVPTPTAR
ncbi:MAG: PfkB family carbohydrate kinase [Tetrasphaera jenkinsii]|jgi:sugar/nucleoside kinase (ribokinase family)|nr:PfkB family carbohydrate kinase [Tetrasphaera jenkinsii]